MQLSADQTSLSKVTAYKRQVLDGSFDSVNYWSHDVHLLPSRWRRRAECRGRWRATAFEPHFHLATKQVIYRHEIPPSDVKKARFFARENGWKILNVLCHLAFSLPRVKTLTGNLPAIARYAAKRRYQRRQFCNVTSFNDCIHLQEISIRNVCIILYHYKRTEALKEFMMERQQHTASACTFPVLSHLVAVALCASTSSAPQKWTPSESASFQEIC